MIGRFVIANVATKEIMRVMVGPVSMAEQQAGPGEVSISHESAGPGTHKLDTDGASLVAYAAAAATRKAARPLWAAEWSNSTDQWLDPRSLTERKTAKRREIQAERERRVVAEKSTSVGTFQARPEDQQNLATVITLTTLAAARGLPAQANFTLANNVRSTFTLAQLEQAALEMGAQGQAVYDQADTLLQQVDAATTAEQLDTIEWPTS